MKMRTIYALALAAPVLGGCGPAPQDTAQPPRVVVENIAVENYFELGPNTEMFSKVPERVVVIGANEAELVMDLGVTDGVIVASPQQNDPVYGIKACNRAVFDTFAQISRPEISAERVLGMNPDLIVAQQEFFSKNRLRSTAFWNEKGIHTMVTLNTTAPAKLNKVETIVREMQFIRDMGAVFHREAAADKIVADTYARIDMIRRETEHLEKPKVMVLDFMSVIASYGRNKIAGDMVAAIGGEIPNTSAAVSVENIIEENPDVVFVVTYNDPAEELEKIRNTPGFARLKFIQNDRLFGIPLKFVYGPQSRTIDAIGYMAHRMYPGHFDFPAEYDFRAE